MKTNDEGRWYIRGKKGCTEQIRKEFIKRGADDPNLGEMYFDEKTYLYYLICGLIGIVTDGSILGKRIIANWEEIKVTEPKPKIMFNPFDKVLACDGKICRWMIDLYERYDEKGKSHRCMCCNYKYCIPYEGNEHLVGVAFDPKHIEGYECGE